MNEFGVYIDKEILCMTTEIFKYSKERILKHTCLLKMNEYEAKKDHRTLQFHISKDFVFYSKTQGICGEKIRV